VLSLENYSWKRAEGLRYPASNKVTGAQASQWFPPGILGRFEPDIEIKR